MSHEKVYREYLRQFVREERQLVINLDDFEFGDMIGKGGFGQVHRAVQKSSGKDCAVKQIFSERLQGNRLRRYIGEIETLARCDNMFLVPFIGFTAEPPYTIVTEYMPNGSLDKYVRGRANASKLSGTKLTAIAIGIAHGMVHLHSLGIVHRDLKAANILLDSRLFPRICDFGIARFEETGSVGMTQKIGTPNYMAPELIKTTDYNNKVDVYAFAMILYEMNENQRPFRGLNVQDIFNAVINNDERPQFTRATPPEFQKLIRRCWDTDPDKRPTFEEIFEILAKGKVEFPGTERRDIQKFLQIIENDEARREKIAESRNHSNTYEEDETIGYYSDYSYDSASKPPPKQQTQQKPKQEQKQEPVIINTKPPRVRNAPALPQKEEKPAPKEKEETESLSDPSTTKSQEQNAEEILRDYNHELFSRYIEYYAKTITPQQFEVFYAPVGRHVSARTPTAALVSVIDGCHAMMKRDRTFIQLFSDKKFFTSLPTGNAEIVDRVVDCYALLFIECPKILGKEHCAPIQALTDLRPEKMLILHSFYIKNMINLPSPWPILDNLFSLKTSLLNKPAGVLYLNLFHHLITQYDVYTNARSIHARPVFVAFTASKDIKTVQAAYNGLALLFDDMSGLDFTRLAGHLLHEQLWKPALSCLLRAQKVAPSVALLEALIYRTNQSPRPWIVLLNIASTKSGAEFLLEHTQWMDEHKKHPSDVFRVFLVIFKNPENRQKAVSLAQFPLMLCSCLDADAPKLHSAISSTIRHSSPDKGLLQKLSQSGFLSKYIKVTADSEEPRFFTHALSTIDMLARIGFAPEFVDFAQPLVDHLSIQRHASDCITVIVSLSFYQQCCAAFREKGLVNYFQNLLKSEKYKQYAESFLANAQNL